MCVSTTEKKTCLSKFDHTLNLVTLLLILPPKANVRFVLVSFTCRHVCQQSLVSLRHPCVFATFDLFPVNLTVSKTISTSLFMAKFKGNKKIYIQ